MIKTKPMSRDVTCRRVALGMSKIQDIVALALLYYAGSNIEKNSKLLVFSEPVTYRILRINNNTRQFFDIIK